MQEMVDVLIQIRWRRLLGYRQNKRQAFQKSLQIYGRATRTADEKRKIWKEHNNY